MRKIKKFVDDISEELEGAKDYAERYVEAKAKEDMGTAARYKEMAGDELRHAMLLHEMVVAEIKEISKVYHPPVDMEEAWEKAHKDYVEKAAWVKQMLTM